MAPISKLREDECIKDISPPLEPLIPDMEIPGLSAGVETSGLHSIVPVLGGVGVDFLIDPVSIYWYGVLQVLRHVILFMSRIQQNGVDISVKLVSNKMVVFRKLCRNNSRSPGEEALGTDVARILENNRFIYGCWHKLYVDSIYQLLIRPCKWGELGWLPLVDNTRLSTFTGSGYPEKAIVRQGSRGCKCKLCR